MIDLIFLPPLSGCELDANTLVLTAKGQSLHSTTLQHALSLSPKACVALHPLDAPLHTVNLPPLALHRRDAALRAKLEDTVLSDVQTLALCVHAASNRVFHVAIVELQVLKQVQTAIAAVHPTVRKVLALSSFLTASPSAQLEPSKQTLFGWDLHRDDHGAGASPATEPVNPSQHAFDLNRITHNPSAFPSHQVSGSVWKKWRWAALLAALCAVVYIASTWMQWRQLLAQETQAHRATATAFMQALPDTPMIDPVLQLQRAAQGGNALTIALGKIPPEWQNGAITEWSWSQMRLTITVNPVTLPLNPAQQAKVAQELAAEQIDLVWSKQ